MPLFQKGSGSATTLMETPSSWRHIYTNRQYLDEDSVGTHYYDVGVYVIMGKYLKKYRPADIDEDELVIHAFVFDKKLFTNKRAIQWLKDHYNTDRD